MVGDMKRKILMLICIIGTLTAGSLTAAAADTATVTFTQDRELVYGNVTADSDNTVNLGNAFEDVAPGETRTQTITLINENDNTVDFYINAQVLQALEENRANAAGAGYDIVLTAADKELYNSRLGGYNNSGEDGSNVGLKEMNDSAINNDVLAATLKKGESAEVALQITFDGEAMDSTDNIDYSNALGALSFGFKVDYKDPGVQIIEDKVVVEKGETRYVTQIVEQQAPLAAVATGDTAMIAGGVTALAAGILLLLVTGRKKDKEDAS